MGCQDAYLVTARVLYIYSYIDYLLYLLLINLPTLTNRWIMLGVMFLIKLVTGEIVSFICTDLNYFLSSCKTFP